MCDLSRSPQQAQNSFVLFILSKEWSGRLANLDPSKCHLECPLCRAKVLLSTSCVVEELPSHFSAIHLVEIVQLQEQAGSKEVIPICQNCKEGEKVVLSCSDWYFPMRLL